MSPIGAELVPYLLVSPDEILRLYLAVIRNFRCFQACRFAPNAFYRAIMKAMISTCSNHKQEGPATVVIQL